MSVPKCIAIRDINIGRIEYNITTTPPLKKLPPKSGGRTREEIVHIIKNTAKTDKLPATIAALRALLYVLSVNLKSLENAHNNPEFAKPHTRKKAK